MKLSLITTLEILTEELIIAKADIDFDTNLSKREYVAGLESKILELLR